VIPDRSLAAILAAERRSSRHPVGAACGDCGTTFPIWLVEGSDPTLCYEDKARREGRPTTEQHALGGLASPLVVEVGANVHRLLSVAQDLTWRALDGPPGSPPAIVTDLLAYLALGEVRS
jgi:hypothetical protein